MGRVKVAVIGGGASGLVAAIAAARQNADVVILDRMNRVGKKILATGNGRCNLSNSNLDICYYHGEDKAFIENILKQFGLNETLDFFREIGIYFKEEDGRIYPYSQQASSVLDVLRYEAERLNIREMVECEAVSVIPSKEGFKIDIKNRECIYAQRVIIAAGGKASPSLGSDGSGYRIAKALGHRIITPNPALVQLRLKGDFFKGLKGTKIDADISVDSVNMFRKEKGEVLFTEYGLSGIPILQVSRDAVIELSKGNRVNLKIDMMPDFDFDSTKLYLKNRFKSFPNRTLEQSLIGLLNKRLIIPVLKESLINDIHKKCMDLTEEEITNLAKTLKEWTFTVTGSQSFSEAQVTSGGVDTKEVDAKTLESKKVKGLYFAGEILDVDGDCGGYNLQWAWSSGYIAGLNSAK